MFDFVFIQMIELSKFYVTVANKKFSQLNNDYEILVQECTDFNIMCDVAAIPIEPSFQFHVLGELELLKINCLYGERDECVAAADILLYVNFFLDVIGIIKSISPSTIVHQRSTFKPLSIVRLLLFDSTGSVEVNLWNDMVRIIC